MIVIMKKDHVVRVTSAVRHQVCQVPTRASFGTAVRQYPRDRPYARKVAGTDDKPTRSASVTASHAANGFSPQRGISENLSQMLDMTFPIGRSRRLIANISVRRGG